MVPDLKQIGKRAAESVPILTFGSNQVRSFIGQKACSYTCQRSQYGSIIASPWVYRRSPRYE